MLVCTRCDNVAVTQHLLLLLLPWSVLTWRPWLQWPTRMPTLLSSSCNPSPDPSFPGSSAWLLPCQGTQGTPRAGALLRSLIHHWISNQCWMGCLGKGPKSCVEEKGQECQSGLCSRLGYGGAMEKLILVIFGWRRYQANRSGKAQNTLWRLQGKNSSTLYPLWIIQPLSLCFFFTTGVRGSSPALPPTSAWQLHYATSLRVFFFFCLGAFFPLIFFVHWHLRNRGGKIFFIILSPECGNLQRGGRREVSSSSLISLLLPFLGCSSQNEPTRPLHCGIEPVVCFAFSFFIYIFFPLKLFHVANLAIISCCLNYICSLWSYISRLK